MNRKKPLAALGFMLVNLLNAQVVNESAQVPPAPAWDRAEWRFFKGYSVFDTKQSEIGYFIELVAPAGPECSYLAEHRAGIAFKSRREFHIGGKLTDQEDLCEWIAKGQVDEADIRQALSRRVSRR